MQLAFGAGALWGNRTDVTGSGIGPDQFGILQDVQIDWDWQTKEFWGQFQFPVDIARGQGKITGKAKFARIFGAIYGDLFFGQTPATRPADGVGKRGRDRAGDHALHGDGRQRRQLR